MPRILGLDFGKRRIGIAVSDEAGIIAMPLCTIRIESDSGALSEIRRICDEKGVTKIVVGMPINMNGSMGPQTTTVAAFAKKVKEHMNIKVETWDERLSSRAAERVLLASDMSRAKRKLVIDKLAAQLILQNYLDALNSGVNV